MQGFVYLEYKGVCVVAEVRGILRDGLSCCVQARYYSSSVAQLFKRARLGRRGMQCP